MWFRVLLLSLMWMSVALVGWLAMHTSAEPEVMGRYSMTYAKALGAGAGVALFLLLANLPPLYWVMFRMRRLVASVLITLVVCLAGLEIGSRFLDPAGVSHFDEIARYERDNVADADPRIVYRQQPGRRSVYQGADFATNEMGLRERPLEAKSDGEFRIAFVGDSVALGWGVPVEQTFVRRIEASLAARLGTKVRTVNAAVGGYNTVQQAAALEKDFQRIEPDLVVLLYTENDIEMQETPFDPWSETEVKGKSPPQIIEAIARRAWTVRLALHRFAEARIEPFTERNRAASGWTMSLSALRSMARLCEQEDVPLVTFFYRTPLTEERGDQLLFDVKAVGEECDFSVFDTLEWWRAVDMKSVTNSRIDHHPNARGHEVLALGIERMLIEKRFLSQ